MDMVYYKKGENSWIRYVKNRIKRRNQNFIALFQGPTGSGKSWSALSMARLIDSEFESRQIVFDEIQLMDIVNADWFKKKKWKIIIFDEPQVTMSNRSWNSIINKELNYMFSTFRHQNIILLFCAPYADFLDSQAMKLLHCIFDCKGIDLDRNQNRINAKLREYNPNRKKTYNFFLRVCFRNGIVEPLKEWRLPKPDDELINEYELRKDKFTSNLNAEIREKLEERRGKVNKKKDVPESNPIPMIRRKPLTDQQKKVMIALSKMNAKEASKEIGLALTAIYSYRRASEKKGYYIDEFKEKLEVQD